MCWPHVSTVWCSRERLPAAADQPAKFVRACSATDYYIKQGLTLKELGRIMTQAVSRRRLTAEARVYPPVQSMWYSWWKNWHWDRFLSEFFGFPLSLSFHRGSPYSNISWGMNNRPVGGRSSETVLPHRYGRQQRLRLCWSQICFYSGDTIRDGLSVLWFSEFSRLYRYKYISGLISQSIAWFTC
jgi:hypothetical protein